MVTRLDGVQVAMISRLIDIKPRPGKESVPYFRRRARASGQIANQVGRWSQAWRGHVLTWQQHMDRAHDSRGWAHRLVGWRAEAWLNQRRIDASHGGTLNRMRTRNQSGRPSVRWFEGVKAAKANAA